jgi:hypothetical protein
MKRIAVLVVAACLCGYALAGTGRAGSITYTETFTASGTLGSLGSFTNAQVTITGAGDTANVGQSGANFINQSILGTVTVAGTGTATLTDLIGAQSRTAGGDGGFFDQAGGFSAFIRTTNSFFI